MIQNLFLPLFSFQADTAKRGDSDSSSFLRSAEDELEDDEHLGQVPETSWAVPQIPSPPTASGLHWPKSSQNQIDSVVSVPDIYYTTDQVPRLSQQRGTAKRRRWQF